jgi:hypothetical protein
VSPRGVSPRGIATHAVAGPADHDVSGEGLLPLVGREPSVPDCRPDVASSGLIAATTVAADPTPFPPQFS